LINPQNSRKSLLLCYTTILIFHVVKKKKSVFHVLRVEVYTAQQALRTETYHRSIYAVRRTTQPNQTHEAKLASVSSRKLYEAQNR